ncbi:Beta-lactamase-like protein 2, variant 2 [Dermatophagoides farinae]|uniref:Beta-lactamase-like protein 2, variant 2 n=1 Tax=Dermatophagoides farinae TaxID=6954 RepID=A0A922L3Z0_DERFA|nr:Beta-lactamase-like protein 2, variant 2 [Dermatophagoides farinae]
MFFLYVLHPVLSVRLFRFPNLMHLLLRQVTISSDRFARLEQFRTGQQDENYHHRQCFLRLFCRNSTGSCETIPICDRSQAILS